MYIDIWYVESLFISKVAVSRGYWVIKGSNYIPCNCPGCGHMFPSQGWWYLWRPACPGALWQRACGNCGTCLCSACECLPRCRCFSQMLRDWEFQFWMVSQVGHFRFLDLGFGPCVFWQFFNGFHHGQIINWHWVLWDIHPPKQTWNLKMDPWNFGDSYWFHHHFQVPAVNFWWDVLFGIFLIPKPASESTS